MKDTLDKMPFYRRDMGGEKVWDYKEGLKYNFWTRQTIGYNEDNCSVSIDGAI